MTIIGLDVATNTGVAVFRPGVEPITESVDLGAGCTRQVRLAAMLKLTKRLIDTHQPRCVWMEAPIRTPRDNRDRNLLLMGLIATCEAWCHIRGVESRLVEIQQLDLFAHGGRVKGSQKRKNMNADWCRELGWKFCGNDESDALVVGAFGMATADPEFAARLTPLLRGV